MSNKKRLLLMVAGLVCCLLFGSLFISYSIFAADIVHKDGVPGGHYESIPFNMKIGEMIQGELSIKDEPLKLGIADSEGTIFRDFGVCDSRLCFHYAANYDGRHYIVVSNPNADSVQASAFEVVADIVTTSLQPGTGSGVKVTPEVTGSPTPPVWTIVIIGVLVGVIVVMSVRRRRRPADNRAMF